jgi:hypothetical protein
MGRIAIAAIVQLAWIFRIFLMAMAKAAEIANFTWGNPHFHFFVHSYSQCSPWSIAVLLLEEKLSP